MSNSLSETDALRLSFDALKKAQPRLYNRDAAARLGVSEAQLVALDAGVLSLRLDVPALPAFLRELAEFTPLLVIVRNDNAVLEITAGALRLEESGGFLNGFFDVKTGEHGAKTHGLDTPHFHLRPESAVHIFAVNSAGLLRRSIQIFDIAGNAVIKFYLRDNTLIAAFDAFAKRHAAADQSPSLRRR